jgi:hypothetical protein
LRDGWAACVTNPAADYQVRLDLERFGLHPYMPQHRRNWLPRGATRPLVRSFPLFKGYIFVPIAEARKRELFFVRGLKQPRHLLSDSEGVLWVAPADAIQVIARTEQEGGFDETPPFRGDRMRLNVTGPLAAMELFIGRFDARTVELLAPLFGGSRMTARVGDLARTTA